MEQHRRSRKSHPSAVEGLIEDVICGRYKRRDEVKEPVAMFHVSYQEKGSSDSECFSWCTFLESSWGQLF